MKAPFIPDAAPFNEDQKAWLSGFLAGLHSRAALNMDAMPVAAAEQTAPKKELNILFGTQTGSSEMVAFEAAEASKKQGFAPVVSGLDDISMEQLSAMQAVIVVIATYGEGEMPDNAELFWDALSASTAPRLEQLKFGVLALGDTSYEQFCQAGKLIDTRLEQLGASRLINRVDCDVDYEDMANNWVGEILPLAAEAVGATHFTVVEDAPPQQEETPVPTKPKWNRKNPFKSKMIEKRLLSGASSAKEIHHFSFDLKDSDLSYEAGDALGVVPFNDIHLIDDITEHLEAKPFTPVTGFNLPLQEVLRTQLEIVTPNKAFVAAVGERTGDEELSNILANGDKEAFDAFLWNKDVLDLLQLGPKRMFSVDEFAGLMKPLQHRAYSISSSPKVHAGEVHLTVAAVKWHYEGREHKGVCSTCLSDDVNPDDKIPIFMSPNRAFRIPANNDVPMIMVGPGTGIAPFRAFLEERREIGAKGKNWLFFGDQHREHDFIYEDEISQMSSDGLLTRLDLAFSRDQTEKIYVQSRMKENGKELFSWLEEGGHFYVCGDATRMAKDVDDMLHKVIADHGGMSDDNASAYVATLKRQKRYVRDVY